MYNLRIQANNQPKDKMIGASGVFCGAGTTGPEGTFVRNKCSLSTVCTEPQIDKLKLSTFSCQSAITISLERMALENSCFLSFESVPKLRVRNGKKNRNLKQ